MQSLRRSIAAAGASFARPVTAAAVARNAPSAAAFAPFAHQLRRRHKSTEALADELVSACDELLAAGKRINWVFLGAPGVGKGTYATRISKLMKIPHISAGDLVREEIKRGTALGAQVRLRAFPPTPLPGFFFFFFWVFRRWFFFFFNIIKI